MPLPPPDSNNTLTVQRTNLVLLGRQFGINPSPNQEPEKGMLWSFLEWYDNNVREALSATWNAIEDDIDNDIIIYGKASDGTVFGIGKAPQRPPG